MTQDFPGPNSIWLWDGAATAVVHRLYHPAGIMSVTWSPDSRWLATSDAAGTLRLWDPATGRVTHAQTSDDANSVVAVEWSPDSRHLLITTGSAIAIRDPFSGREELRLPDGRSDAQWSPGGTYIAALGAEFVLVWNARTGREVLRLGPANTWWSQLEWRPDGRQLVAADPTALHIWAMPSGTPVRVLATRVVSDRPASASWSPTGRQLLTLGSDDRIHIWDAASWREVRTLPTPHDASGPFAGPVEWSSDGRRVLVGGPRPARIWNIATGQDVAVREGGPGDAAATAWSPDGQRVLIANRYGGLRLYPATGGPGKTIADFAPGLICETGG